MVSDWKTYIENFIPNADGSIGINVVFVNEILGRKEPRNVRTYSADLNIVKTVLRDARARLDAFELIKELPTGELDIEETPPVDDADAKALAEYFAAYQFFRAVRVQVVDGLAAQSDQDAAFSALQKLYKSEYLGKA